jgi:hypothetical protein
MLMCLMQLRSALSSFICTRGEGGGVRGVGRNLLSLFPQIHSVDQTERFYFVVCLLNVTVREFAPPPTLFPPLFILLFIFPLGKDFPAELRKLHGYICVK